MATRPPSADPAAAFARRLAAVTWEPRLDPAAPGEENMAQDARLLEAAAHGGAPTLRFYAWKPPAVSLGRFQSEEGIQLEYARRRGWDVVRRVTGGRAVLHQFEVTYSLTLPPALVDGVGIRSGYTVLSRVLNRGLATLLGADRPPVTAPACEATRNRSPNCFALASECDTLVADAKLVGSAQVRHQGALLQHGSILLDAEPEAWQALFGETGRLVTLRELLGRPVTAEEVISAVMRGFDSLKSWDESITSPPV